MPAAGGDGSDAADLAGRAEDVAGKLKVGSWESVQALALVSIAKSLLVLAQAAQDRDT